MYLIMEIAKRLEFKKNKRPHYISICTKRINSYILSRFGDQFRKKKTNDYWISLNIII